MKWSPADVNVAVEDWWCCKNLVRVEVDEDDLYRAISGGPARLPGAARTPRPEVCC